MMVTHSLATAGMFHFLAALYLDPSGSLTIRWVLAWRDLLAFRTKYSWHLSTNHHRGKPQVYIGVSVCVCVVLQCVCVCVLCCSVCVVLQCVCVCVCLCVCMHAHMHTCANSVSQYSTYASSDFHTCKGQWSLTHVLFVTFVQCCSSDSFSDCIHGQAAVKCKYC